MADQNKKIIHTDIIGKIIQEEMFGLVMAHATILEMECDNLEHIFYDGKDRGIGYKCKMHFYNDRMNRQKDQPYIIYDYETIMELLKDGVSHCPLPGYPTLLFRLVPQPPDPMLTYPYEIPKATA